MGLIGSLLKLLSYGLAILLIGPPLIGAAVTIMTTVPMPIFAPKDTFSKLGYGATWGFWTTWQWIRPVAGMTGGAQVAVTKLLDHTIQLPNSTDDLNASQKYLTLCQSLVTMERAYVANETDAYISYAQTYNVDVNQTWWVTVYMVSNSGLVNLAQLDISWSGTLAMVAASAPMNAPTLTITPHYGIVITQDTVDLFSFFMTSNQIDYVKLGMDTLETLYKGNVQFFAY